MKLLAPKKVIKVRVEHALASRQTRGAAHCQHFRHGHHVQPNA